MNYALKRSQQTNDRLRRISDEIAATPWWRVFRHMQLRREREMALAEALLWVRELSGQ